MIMGGIFKRWFCEIQFPLAPLCGGLLEVWRVIFRWDFQRWFSRNAIIPSGRHFWRKCGRLRRLQQRLRRYYSAQNVGEPFRNGSPTPPPDETRGTAFPLPIPSSRRRFASTKPVRAKWCLAGKRFLGEKIYNCIYFDIAKLPQKMRLFAEKALFFEGGSGDNLSPDR